MAENSDGQCSIKNREPERYIICKEWCPCPDNSIAHGVRIIIGYIFIEEVEEDQQNNTPGNYKGRTGDSSRSFTLFPVVSVVLLRFREEGVVFDIPPFYRLTKLYPRQYRQL